MNKFDKFVYSVSRLYYLIAGIAMTYVLVVSVLDILMNKLFKHPLNWAFDSIGLVASIAILFAIPEVQKQHGNIEVEILEERLPRIPKKVTNVIINILCIVLWIIISWRSIIYGIDILKSGEVSMSVGIPIFPFIWLQSLAAIAVVLVLISQTILIFRKTE